MFDRYGRIVCSKCKDQMKVMRLSNHTAIFACVGCNHSRTLRLYGPHTKTYIHPQAKALNPPPQIKRELSRVS